MNSKGKAYHKGRDMMRAIGYVRKQEDQAQGGGAQKTSAAVCGQEFNRQTITIRHHKYRKARL